MKKLFIFLAGILLGIGIMAVVFNVDKTDESSSVEVEESPQPHKNAFADDIEIPGEIINIKSFKVFQVYNQIVALVHGKDEYGYYNGTVYMLKNNEMDLYTKKVSPFYDDQIINVPKGKVVRLFGTYHYYTNNGYPKTVPVVRIVDK